MIIQKRMIEKVCEGLAKRRKCDKETQKRNKTDNIKMDQMSVKMKSINTKLLTVMQ